MKTTCWSSAAVWFLYGTAVATTSPTAQHAHTHTHTDTRLSFARYLSVSHENVNVNDNLPPASFCCSLFSVRSQGRYSEGQAARIMAEVASAVGFLHRNAIVHFDLVRALLERISCISLLYISHALFR